MYSAGRPIGEPRVGFSTLIVILLIVVFSAGQVLARPATTLAQEDLNESLPSFPNATDATFGCVTVDNVAVFEDRIYIRCSNPIPNTTILYFAYPTDPAHIATANQMLAVANTAFAYGEGVVIFYNSNSVLNPSGCNISDCRGLVGVSMVK